MASWLDVESSEGQGNLLVPGERRCYWKLVLPKRGYVFLMPQRILFHWVQ
jgi:hypothetical protein